MWTCEKTKVKTTLKSINKGDAFLQNYNMKIYWLLEYIHKLMEHKREPRNIIKINTVFNTLSPYKDTWYMTDMAFK